MLRIGLRREDKGKWERRAAISPAEVRALAAAGVEVVVQSSPVRVFDDAAYREAGAVVRSELGDCPVILGVKEIPAARLAPDRTYAFFSHTIKGQPGNMPMLARLLALGCTLIDYEKIADETGRRLVAFGRHAGLAGMIDTLWAFGQRLRRDGLDTAFATIEPAHRYRSLAAAEQAVAAAGRRHEADGVPASLRPLVFGVAGYGNVSRGAQEVLRWFGMDELAPDRLGGLRPDDPGPYLVVFEERHLVRRRDAAAGFALEEYYDSPERYVGRFDEVLPQLTVLVNAIYWTERYPRLVTREWARQAWAGPARPRLRVIGDISCDIGGAVELTVRATTPAAPVFVYEPASGATRDGVDGDGPVVLAVDNLPAELAADATADFGRALAPFLPALAAVDTSGSLVESGLPPELQRATIAWRGRLTPDFAYLAPSLTPPRPASAPRHSWRS